MGKAFESIAQGLKEAIAFSEGKPVAAKTYRPEEIDKARPQIPLVPHPNPKNPKIQL